MRRICYAFGKNDNWQDFNDKAKQPHLQPFCRQVFLSADGLEMFAAAHRITRQTAQIMRLAVVRKIDVSVWQTENLRNRILRLPSNEEDQGKNGQLDRCTGSIHLHWLRWAICSLVSITNDVFRPSPNVDAIFSGGPTH